MDSWHPPQPSNTSNPHFDIKHYPQKDKSNLGHATVEFEELWHHLAKLEASCYGTFGSADEWQLAKWAMDMCLSVPCQLSTRPGRGFHNSCSLFQSIDHLPCMPSWMCKMHTIKTHNPVAPMQEVMFWYHDPVSLVRELIGNPHFEDKLHYHPTKLYTRDHLCQQAYCDMNNFEWWWNTQVSWHLAILCIVAPVILASDKTQLIHFTSGMAAYLMYLSIGNIPKSICHQTKEKAMMLLAYLPTDKLMGFGSPAACAHAEHHLFHMCMAEILQPLIKAGTKGVKMTCADRYSHMVFPILGSYIADYPEQCLVMVCCHQHCPKCTVPSEEKGALTEYPLCMQQVTLELMHQLDITSNTMAITSKKNVYHNTGIHPIDHPFWESLPYTNICACITPNPLHELHKEVFKDHLFAWCLNLAGAEEVDAHFKRVPPHHGLKNSERGVSGLLQMTGTEHHHMQKTMAALLVGLPGNVTSQTLHAMHAILDFIYLSHLPMLTEANLQRMEHSLAEFHAHKEAFQVASSCKDFHHIPKLHKLQHYIAHMPSHSPCDNFNTELPEHLHINLVKLGYHAGNKHDYIAHMTTWLER
ncbi:hypothetical protein DACRYDRAFT_57836 [Dacryopinax primogenitus]|uniref:Uncharacterized protein n=1 Tax=Dacryopinax primogenitus (strain DJM 731) TaxID=1858805 RepID=M5FR54_DACPD|nr:uncharacterized protein DACRYDRAFT_57836 [Dacryopinax primogenitus]EJT98093.1 hypothetical protein DACRYDRAFT_57836 [Dacryopinax primogenitus]